jgi:hypothetical protein
MRLTALPVLLASVAAASVAAPSPRRVRAGAAGGISLYLKSTTFTREASVDFGARGPLSRSRAATGTAVLEFDLRSGQPDLLDGMVQGRLSGKFAARDDRGQSASRVLAEVIPGEDIPALRLTVEGLTPNTRALSAVEGELSAFPDSRRIRFHVPWLKDEVPVSVEVYGGRATLKRFQLVGADSTLWVAVKPPEGFRPAPLDQPGSLTARAMDIDGNLVNGGGVTEVQQTATDPEPEFRFFAPGLRRTPSRLMLDMLFVAGAPRQLPFRLGPIALP